MDISCEQCGVSFKVADDKLPPGKSAVVKCPKCKNRITVSGPAEDEPAGVLSSRNGAGAGTAFGFDERPDESQYNASEKPFDFIEEEGETALICESDSAIKGKIKQVLDFMEYHISETDDTRDALKKMRYHNYHLIVINESFSSRSPDSNGVLIYLERLKMKSRRGTFVVLLTKRFKTMDAMTAFEKSVELIINLNDINHFEKILKRALADHEQFYRIYREEQKSLGIV
ncbi:MAG: zinc-ribbon domain-containing protein [Thermodesulfobacteriota bacterium]